MTTRRPGPWPDPWTWSELRRVRRHLRLASLFMTIAIIIFAPAAWVLLMPMDPTLRPDLTAALAWIGVAICLILGWSGQTMARRARAQFDHAIYTVTRAARNAGVARNIPLEIDIGEVYPPVILSRQHRTMGICGPTPLLINMDDMTSMTVTDGKDETGLARQPHLVVHLAGKDPDRVIIVPGRGLSRANIAQIEMLRDRFNEFLEPHQVWNTKPDTKIDMAAFVDSLRPAGSQP